MINSGPRRHFLQPSSVLFGKICNGHSNPGHFNLDSRSSLHDAWLETLTIRETASGERKQIRQLEVHVRLLGPYHDRWIHLNYAGVTQYSHMQLIASAKWKFRTREA